MEHELFRHLEIELFVTRSHLKAALEHVRETVSVFGGQKSNGGLTEEISAEDKGTYCHHYPICVRRVMPDDTLISMSSNHNDSEEDWYAISFISYERPDRRSSFFAFAKFLASSMRDQFGARCHWGKYNPLDRSDNEQLYPRLDQFREVVKRFDPQSRFSNQWLGDVLLEDTSCRL